MCVTHVTKKFFFCISCKDAFCPMCLLEDKAHEGHPRQNLKDLAPGVQTRLQLINSGLIEKRNQMEQSAQEIQREINDIGEQVTKVSLPEITNFAQ